MDIAIPSNHSVKLKESKKRDKYLDFAREQKKKQQLWNMKVRVIPIVLGALGTIPEGLIKTQEDLEIRGQLETIHITALLRSAGILRSILES